ncbi:MAG: hypothetical protein ACRCRW_00465 [Aeromonadaceae bacterium]
MKLYVSLGCLLWSLASFSVHSAEHDIPGFITEVEEGRLWVFKEGSLEYQEFKKHGEPLKQFSNIGAGPNGMTVKSADQSTLDSYLSEIAKAK